MKLSIIVAVYNTSKYIEQCLKSVFNQTLPDEDYEVIIVNDCSTDNSMEIIESLISGRSNVRVIDKKLNEATFWSRVDGIEAASGDYIGFVDSDDWCDLNMYKVMLEKAEESGADIVECGTVYEYPDGIPRHVYERKENLTTGLATLKGYSQHPIQVALYLRLFKRTIMDSFMKDMYPYFNNQREKYRGIRNEDDLLIPLFFGLADRFLNIEECFCHHRMEIENSTMDLIRKNPKKEMDSTLFRVSAGFDVMNLSKNRKEIYQIIEHKQINVIFGLLGRLLQTEYYSKEESAKFMKEAIKRFEQEKKWLTLKDKFRFVHLKLKTWYCYGK